MTVNEEDDNQNNNYSWTGNRLDENNGKLFELSQRGRGDVN
jgi:hypothetical protein